MYKWLFIVRWLQLLTIAAAAQEGKSPALSLRGYLKDLPSLHVYGALDSSASANLIHFRVDLKAQMSDALTARAGIRTRLYTGSLVRQTPRFAEAMAEPSGGFRPSKTWLERGNAVGHTGIDRLAVQYSPEGWDITLGRQRINWGVHAVWNPNDIFNTYNFLDFDYEERPGSDAIRVQHPLPRDAGLELAWAPGKDRHGHIAAGLYRVRHKSYDLQWMAGICRGDWVVGTGWAGSIGEMGFKGEMSYFHPWTRFRDTMGTGSVSLMADRTWPGDWYFSCSMLYVSHPSGMMQNGTFSSVLTAKSLFPYRLSCLATVSKVIGTVHRVTWSTVVAREQATCLFLPSYSWNATDAFDLDCFVQAFISDDGGAWQLQGASLFLRGRWSF